MTAQSTRPRDPTGPDAAAADAVPNPYLRARTEDEVRQADLDAGAPVLRSSDLQRLNRKALAFLAGIIVLLLLAAAWMFNQARSGNAAPARVRNENVVVPELPQVALTDPRNVADAVAPIAPIAPVALAPLDASDALPPLPAIVPDRPQPVVAAPARPTLLERRIAADGTSMAAGAGIAADPYVQAMQAVGMASASGQPFPAAAGTAVQADPGNRIARARRIANRDALLVRGTYLRCVLETRIVTDIPGFTSCVVTEPIYSMTGCQLLVAKGSKLSGRYDSEANGPRIAVVWDRITTPDGVDVAMQSPGIDNLGGAGHPGDYNAHWASRVSAALMISLLSDAFKYAGERNGPTSTTVTNGIVTQEPFQSNTAQTLQRMANQAVDRSLQRPATVTINQGTVVTVYVAADVDFSTVLGGS